MEGLDLLEPFFRRQAFGIQRQDVDVTIADVSNRDAVEVVFFAQLRDLFGDFRNLVQGDDEVFRLEHLVNVAGGFGELLAQSPNPFIRFKFVDRAVGFRQVAEIGRAHV